MFKLSQNEENYLLSLIEKGSDVWFTSDWHFSHKNIVRFEYDVRNHLVPNKPNDNQSLTEEQIATMDTNLVAEWNNTIKENDIVFFLGDFSFGKNNIDKILKQLNGVIVFIQGNHDTNLNSGQYDHYFFKRCPYLEIKLPHHDKENKQVDLVMFHFPIFEWNRMYHNSIHLYGHLHSKEIKQIFPKEYQNQAINVCYDYNHGKILNLRDIVALSDQ